MFIIYGISNKEKRRRAIMFILGIISIMLLPFFGFNLDKIIVSPEICKSDSIFK
jgi:hypothetical protein